MKMEVKIIQVAAICHKGKVVILDKDGDKIAIVSESRISPCVLKHAGKHLWAERCSNLAGTFNFFCSDRCHPDPWKKKASCLEKSWYHRHSANGVIKRSKNFKTGTWKASCKRMCRNSFEMKQSALTGVSWKEWANNTASNGRKRKLRRSEAAKRRLREKRRQG